MTRATVALAAVGIVLLAACSEHQDPMGTSGTGEVVEIEIRNFEFSQPELHVALGTTKHEPIRRADHILDPSRHRLGRGRQPRSIREHHEKKNHQHPVDDDPLDPVHVRLRKIRTRPWPDVRTRLSTLESVLTHPAPAPP